MLALDLGCQYSRWEHTQSKGLSGNGELSELSGERCPYSPDQRLVCKCRNPAPVAATRQGKLGLRGTRGLLGTDLGPPYGGGQEQPPELRQETEPGSHGSRARARDRAKGA